MHHYLKDTEFAVENLFKLATGEEKMLRELALRLANVEEQLRVNMWDFESSDLNDDFSEGYVMAAFGRMAKAHQEAATLQSQMTSIQASIGSHQQAMQTISGAILQIAKQGISIVYGGIEAAPEGRKLGSLPIRDIIWQSRNQAMHFECDSFHKPVTALFAKLESEYGSQFSLVQHANQSRAKQVLGLLSWNNYEHYLNDMALLLL
jgi:hypothetical protein